MFLQRINQQLAVLIGAHTHQRRAAHEQQRHIAVPIDFPQCTQSCHDRRPQLHVVDLHQGAG